MLAVYHVLQLHAVHANKSKIEKNKLNVYFYKIQIYKSSIYINMTQMIELKNQGALLIKLIQNEYDLE